MRRSFFVLLSIAFGCGGRQETAPTAEDTGVGDTAAEAPYFPPFDSNPPVTELLEVTPGNAIVFIDLADGGSAPGKQAYKAIGHRSDGTILDVTAESTFDFLGTPLGVFAGNELTTFGALPAGFVHGAWTRIRATHGSAIGYAELVVAELDTKNDLFVVTPYLGAPTPTKSVLRVRSPSTTLDVALARSIEPNPEGATLDTLVSSIRAMEEGDVAAGCAAHAASDSDGDGVKETFASVPSSTTLCFEIGWKSNKILLPKSNGRFVAGFADVIGSPGAVKGERHMLVFYVPSYFKTD